MAREMSILKLRGKLDGMSFYKNSEGHFVRAKGGVERNRIMNDPNYERTRENMSEFGTIASSGKLLRNSISILMNRAKDTRTSNRIVSLMSTIKNLDNQSLRGQRKVAEGIKSVEGKRVLEGFDFNKNSPLGILFKAPYTLDVEAGSVNIALFNPKEHLLLPEYATHVSLSIACASLDIELQQSEVAYSEVHTIAIDADAAPLEIGLENLPTLEGTLFYLLLVELMQEINGQLYPLKNGTYNALNLIKVV